MARAASRAAPGPDRWLTSGDTWVTIEIIVRPGAGRRGVVKLDARGLVIALNSPPEKGKASDELLAYLARELKVARSIVAIIRGETSRQKTIRIEPCDPALVTSHMKGLASATRAAK